jgi:GMP synthase (glutamine-hydrolysing)
MRIHSIIHAPFEKLGAIENWIAKRNHSLITTHTYNGDVLPSPSEFDFLIIMGGPQSPCELEQYPYLRDEIALTKAAILANKIVLGFCLGAQIIAEALGVKTMRSPHKEVGVYPITLTDEGEVDPLFQQFPVQFDVMHWHNDMPGIPAGAVLLAKSEGCPQQAFRYGDRVYGLQFHMEMTAELVRGMIEHCPWDLRMGDYIRTRAELLAADHDAINRKLEGLLDYLGEFCLERVVG